MTGHAHRIRIEEPNGPTSTGRCLICGIERTYRNSGDEYTWQDTNNALDLRAEMRRAELGFSGMRLVL